VTNALRAGLGGLFVIAACRQPAPPVLAGRSPPGDPATPAPTVTWADRVFTTTGLPAIAHDGSSIVVAHRDSDGGRGNPNLTLIEKDRDDRELGRFVVVSSDDVDRLDPRGLELRIARATAWLEDRHAARHLVAMTALVTSAPTDGAPAQAIGAGVTLRWAPSQLVVVLGRGRGAPLSRATPAGWLAPDYPLCQTCSEVCHNDAFLGGAYADLERSAVVVVVAYRGSDTCWEPGSQEHVVVW
jgi:hypothetical protein